MMTRTEKIEAGKVWQIYLETNRDKVLFEGSKTAAIKFAREHFGRRWKRGDAILGKLIWEAEMKSKLVLPNGSSQYGAQMGRQNTLPEDPDHPIKLRMERLRWVDGDYDQWGAYWGGGSGDSVYCAYGEDNEIQVYVFVRARSRFGAKRAVREALPNAKFYN